MTKSSTYPATIAGLKSYLQNGPSVSLALALGHIIPDVAHHMELPKEAALTTDFLNQVRLTLNENGKSGDFGDLLVSAMDSMRSQGTVSTEEHLRFVETLLCQLERSQPIDFDAAYERIHARFQD